MNGWKPTQTQIEAAAREEMVKKCSRCGYVAENTITNRCPKCGYLLDPTPSYDEDHNSVQRLIDGLNDVEAYAYQKHLEAIVMRDATCNNGFWSWEAAAFALRASASQKFQAVCKAKGWE